MYGTLARCSSKSSGSKWRWRKGTWSGDGKTLSKPNHVGQKVRVRGWYRRAPVPYIEAESLWIPGSSQTQNCYFRQGTLFWSVFFALLGGWATATQTDILSAFWNTILVVLRFIR